MIKEIREPSVAQYANEIRLNALSIILDKGGGYLTQASSAAEILATLFARVLKLSLEKDRLPLECPIDSYVPFGGSAYYGEKSSLGDRLFISPGHYAMAVYCTLAAVGILPPEALEAFGADGSCLEAIGNDFCPGFETNAGTLGQTISIAAGVALSRKNRLDSGKVYVFISDGELQSGQTWEAIQAAVHYRLDNLVIVIDNNFHQVEGLTKDVMNVEDILDRLRAFGADAVRIDGHNPEDLAKAMLRQTPGKPNAVICDTDPTFNMDFLKEYEPFLHYFRINDANRDSVEKQRHLLSGVKSYD